MDKKGFTLVEIVMSALILGITISPMLFSINMSRMNAEKAKHYTEAMNHARAAMEQYINEGTVYTLPDGAVKTLNGSCSVTTTAYALGIDNVTVTVSWNERGMGGVTNTASVELVTLIRD